MNRFKKSNLNDLKDKVQWCQKLIAFGFIIAISVFITGCEKENNNDTDEYYVKYEVSSSTIYIGGKLDVIIKTETNETMTVSINQRTDWESVIGPVKKGFNATLKVNAVGETYDKLKLYTNIHVSKNNRPFALKVSDGSDTPRDLVEINHTIDY